MSGKKVFIGNLSYKTKEADLIDAFKQCGKVVDAKVVRKMNGLSKGFGFVEFEKDEDARKAVEELDKIEIFDRPINVQLSTSSGEKTSNFNDDDYVPQKRSSPKFEQRPIRRNDQGYSNNRNDQGYSNNNRRPRSNMSSFRSDNNSNRRSYTLTRRDGDRRDNGRRFNQNRRQGRRQNRAYGYNKVSDKKSDENENENIQKVESKSTVFIANLPFSFQDEDLVELFKVCGDIKTAHVVRTEYRSRGYGFVEFENKEGQENAIKKMNDFPVKVDNGEDRKLIVKIAVNIEDE
jgi:RNA recognition motif-containing protein